MHDQAKLDALRARVAALSSAQQALLRQQLEAQGIAWEQVEPAAPEAPLTRPEHLPLSAAQAHLWVLHQLHPTLTAYHIAFAWTFDGALDDAALAGAWRAVVARHEALRTVFRQQADGTPYQFVLDDPPCALGLEELPGAAADWAAAVEARAQALAGEPFDLRAGPLFRTLLLRRDRAHHVLVVVLHHLIADGWSRGLLMRELASCYRALAAGRPPALPALAAQYAEHVLAEQRWLKSAEQTRARAYWQRQLAGLTPLELPADRPRPAEVSFAGGLHTRLLSRELSLALRPFARRQGASLFMVLLTAFHVLLHRHTGERDLAIGVPVAGRNDEQDAALIGYFVNTLVLRTQFAHAASSSFETWLARLKASFADAIEHQALPFSRVVEACGIDRRLARNPLFEIMFQVQGDGYQTQNAAAPAVDLPGLQMQQHWVALAETKFDLSWHVIEREEGLLLAIEYRTALFDAARIARMSEHFERLLSAVLAAPAAPLAKLDLLWSMERARLLALATEPDAPLAAALPGSFAAAFAAQCARTPEAVAVTDGTGRMLGYRELQRRAAVLAAALRARGVGAECVVGVCLPRSLELVVALLGVLDAGGAWLPLDPTLPAARLAYMLKDARYALALGTPETASRLASADCRWLLVDAWGEREDAPQTWPQPADDALAYVMYTSGSSGRPKGTLLTQAGLMHYLRCGLASYPMEAGDGSPVHMSIGFDATITSLLAPLLAGRAVHLLPEGEELAALATALAAGHSVVKLTPAHLAALPPLLPAALPKEGLPKAFVIGGEALTAQHVEFWRERYPEIALVNEYGPTETVVGCCTHVVGGGDERGPSIPIGRPLAGIALYVLDEALNLCPLGVPGELYIAGPTVARGYLGQPALSAERFLPNPFACKGGAHGTVMYRSGDRARWRADGLLEYLGRADLQLKLRGHRIEPGEIEVALGRHPAVAEAVVCLREIAGRPRLVAYYVADTTLGEEAAAELRSHLARTLPAYMLPDHFVPLARLPLTHNGKVDRAALPVPRPATATAQRPASTAREHALLEIWQQILGREGLSIDDNFFELGGDSISGMQIVALARQRGLVLSPAQLFEHQTIAGQALVASELPPDDEVEEDVTVGAVPLAPVQWEFLAHATAPHHFNQGVLLRVQPGLAAESLRQALQQLPVRHAALRLRYARTEESWQQHYTEDPVRVPLEEIDLSAARGDFEHALDAALAPLQASFDLAAGPLFAAALVRGGAHGDRLLLVAHHLIVDGVSWRVLLHDLARLHADVLHGRDCAPPPPSASYGAWTRRLAARGAEIAKERAYWLEACRPGAVLPCDVAVQGAPRVAEAAEHRCSLGAGETALLLAATSSTTAPAALCMLLTALLHTLKQWCGSGALSVDIESHGRQGWNDKLDLSRTVGWFTAVHPLRVELPAGAPADQLAAVGAALARVPEQGVGYGVLRMQGDAQRRAALRSPAELCFNYLGQWRADGDGEWLLGLAPEALSSWVSPQGLRRHPLDVIAWVAEGRLELLWRYDTRRHRAQTIERLAQRHLAALASLLAVTSAKGAPSTPRAAGLSAPGVERLLAKVRARPER